MRPQPFPLSLYAQGHAAHLEYLRILGSISLADGGPESTNNPTRAIFGADEFAGDMEIAYFVACAAAAAAATRTAATTSSTSATAAGAIPAKGTTQAVERSVLLSLSKITLRAVPIHAGDTGRRYDPYHLCIVHREVDRGRQGQGEGGRVPSQATTGEDTMYVEDDPDQRDKEEDSLPGFDRAGLGAKGGGGAGNGQDIEVACFCETGVTYVNLHGETSFQPLDEWHREKERFDILCRMDFFRRYVRKRSPCRTD